MNKEIWKPIENASKYEISNLGRVRSLVHRKGSIYKKEDYPLILKQGINKKGYCVITIRDDNDKLYTIIIHRQVCISFLCNELNLEQVNHKNGNKLNNSIENLEWITNGDNMRHSYAIGLRDGSSSGEKNGRARLCENEVIYIYTNPENLKINELSKMFCISKSTIRSIYNKKLWTKTTENLVKNCVLNRKKI